jgi:hypothetical protein
MPNTVATEIQSTHHGSAFSKGLNFNTQLTPLFLPKPAFRRNQELLII